MARLQYNVLGESAIGLIGTFGDPRDEANNGLIGFDILTLTTRHGDSFAISYTRDYENLRRKPLVRGGKEIPLGSYTFDRYAVKVNFANSRVIRPTVEYLWGTYYNGKLRQLTAVLELRPIRFLFLSLEYNQNDANLNGDKFTQRLARIRARVGFTSEISWSSVVQYDNEEDSVGLNSILRWEVQPGNDIYLVFNYRWHEKPSDQIVKTSIDTALKLAWTFRF